MTKELFIRKYEAQILTYLYLLKATKICHDVIKNFNGKVVNARFPNAMKSKNRLDRVFYSIEGQWLKIYTDKHRSFSTGDCTVSYIDTAAMFIDIIRDNGRLNTEKTIEKLKEKENEFALHITKCRYCIEHWEDHMIDLQNIRNIVSTYNKKWPSEIKAFIDIKQQ